MKIVVADPIFLTEAYRRRLDHLGEVDVYDTYPADDAGFRDRIRDAEVVVVGRYGMRADAFAAAPHLRMVAVWQTGYDHVDLEAATRAGVVVSNVPAYAFEAVAEFVFAYALALLRRVHVADARLRGGGFDWREYCGRQLMGMTIGVIGTGDIGTRVVQIAHGFGMRVLSTTAHPSPERARRLGLEFVDLKTLLAESDILTLHVPLTPSTERMIGARELALMKPGAILINTSRGRVIDEGALVEALAARRLAGAGLDVFEHEPLPQESPLRQLDNVLLSPHIAFLTEESMDECTFTTIQNIEHFAAGRPENVVNPGVLERGAAPRLQQP
ncbi:glycerate dehydrogenase [Methanoculleus sp. Wushi-C6]|uniref:Glycerate dehydrogenase n=1 Tax=Methanoculleus caldifontis TaxID=2651577 RepID=A0ABU3X065_9EURY|nr:2-hydroxyacid dehydrogenase [Methanoculleus sp. Wushi-C6]MDV2481433.1 glycerate dehydrogenase [Methanoculleus sp. Wushi-C6]